MTLTEKQELSVMQAMMAWALRWNKKMKKVCGFQSHSHPGNYICKKKNIQEMNWS